MNFEVRDFVLPFGILRSGDETVQEPLGHECLLAVRGRKLNSSPLNVAQRVDRNIDNDIVDHAAGAAPEPILRARQRLKAHSLQSADISRKRMVVLHESRLIPASERIT